ncbi:MAG TPA: hypothetical protein H9744_11955 [Candidatus Eisenbergiella stercoravium]|nr:hypothetical protein [Candidatus Eisenbergiella stercoravium]
MAIGILMLLFIIISLLSLIGILLLFLWKESPKREILFHLLAVWGLLIAACGILSLPSNFIASRIISFSIGLLAAIGLFWYRNIEKRSDEAEMETIKSHHAVSFLLVTSSIVLGILKLYGLV